MTKLTLRGMVDAIIAIDLDNVAQVYSSPPESVATADLPCLYPDLLTIGTNERIFNCDGMTEDVTAILVIAVEPFGQDTQQARFDLSVLLADELRDAFADWDYSLFIDYTVDMVADIVISQKGYWGVRATITATNSR